MFFSNKGRRKIEETKSCCFCDNTFHEKEEGVCDKIEDHCQTKGTYHGAAKTRWISNAKQRQSSILPVASKIMTKYESLFFMKKLINRTSPSGHFEINPKLDKNIRSITYGQLNIIDLIVFENESWYSC